VRKLDRNKLLYFIKDRGYKIEDFCESIGMSYAAFYGKCKEERFLLKEIWKISELLNLSMADIDSIFFVNYVSTRKQMS
jgi:hypothetical protein